MLGLATLAPLSAALQKGAPLYVQQILVTHSVQSSVSIESPVNPDQKNGCIQVTFFSAPLLLKESF